MTSSNTNSSMLVSIKDFEEFACSVLPRNALDYYRSGAGAQETLANNSRAFSKLKIRPRCLRNVAVRDLSAMVLGRKIALPVGVSPTAMQRMAHPEGECANARGKFFFLYYRYFLHNTCLINSAAQATGTIFILSTIATSSIEEIASAAPLGIKWFQLYIYNDRYLVIY